MAKILIVDDEPDIVAALARFFERAGHDVLRAGTGEEGVALAQAEHPAVMLLDLYLPDMSGFDVLERTREQHPVVIMVTGHGDIPLAAGGAQDCAAALGDFRPRRSACRCLRVARPSGYRHSSRLGRAAELSGVAARRC